MQLGLPVRFRRDPAPQIVRGHLPAPANLEDLAYVDAKRRRQHGRENRTDLIAERSEKGPDLPLLQDVDTTACVRATPTLP